MTHRCRIFVGGLLESIGDADVEKLFSSFGKVIGLDRMGYKERTFYRRNKHVRVRYERRIAFLTLEVAEDKVALKAVKALNGTKWKGATLRCQLAKPSGLERVRHEIDKGHEEEEEEEKGEDPVEKVEVADVDGPNKIRFDQEEEDGMEVAGASRWEDIETPARSTYNFEKHLMKCADDIRQQRAEMMDHDSNDDGDGEGPGTMPVHTSTLPPSRDESLVEAFLKEQDANRVVVYGKKKMDTVEFLSEEDVAILGKNTPRDMNLDLSRFDSESEDEVQRIPQVDGAYDTSSSSSASSSSDDEEKEASTSTSTSSSSSDDENDGDSPRATEEIEIDGHSKLLESMFPSGAAFFGTESSRLRAEATLVGNREQIRKSLKDLNKQAKRVQGRSSQISSS